MWLTLSYRHGNANGLNVIEIATKSDRIIVKESGAQLGGGLPCPFLKFKKKGPDNGKKGPNCVHPWVESSIQKVVLRVSRRKSSKSFLCGAFFSCVFDEKFIKSPNSSNLPLP